MPVQLTVRAHELATLLERAPEGITTLSLDCFDTLMWRNVAAPRDVFAEIPLPGGGIEPRMWAEGVAQRMTHARTGSREIGLDAIYRRMLAGADDARVADGIAHELACEARHLFPFAPVVELMRDAKRRGLGIIIVSDMYLSEAQLRALLTESAGADVVDMIDHIFMSSDHGMPKAGGLFLPVLQAIGAKPAQVLHVGDNRHADYEGAARYGIHAVHFDQFGNETKQRLRLEAAAGIMLDPATRVTRPAYQSHRAQVSLRRDEAIATVVGHDVMGPVMHAFATWLKGELDAQAAKLGKPVRPLFLMRDGYLPFRAFDTLYPEAGARAIEISRLTAARASLCDDAALDRFVAEQIDVLPAEALAKQLLLFGPEIASIVKPRRGHDPQKALKKALAAPELRRKILARSAKFAERLVAHLRRNDVGEGDAVMLVDVGYNGSVQNIVTPVLRNRLNLDLAGRYLLLREEVITGYDKAGMLGTDLFEFRALHALCSCVALIEQMCNIAAGSTVDYRPEGEPIREESGLKSQQNAARDAVQAACLDYVRADTSAMHRRPASDTTDARRRMAGAILTRLLFMPLESEVRLFERFDHDVNLGTKAMTKLLDHDGAAEGLRRRGISYINETKRMYVPGEILKHGLPLNLSLLTTSRFGLDMRDSDFLVGGIDVPVFVLDDAEQSIVRLKAHPTHDGYYRLAVPVGLKKPTLAIQLGQLCELVQIDDLSWTPIDEFNATFAVQPVPATWVPDAIMETEDGLHRCAPTGVLIVPPPAAKEPQVLTIVFRPIRWRDAASPAQRQEAA